MQILGTVSDQAAIQDAAPQILRVHFLFTFTLAESRRILPDSGPKKLPGGMQPEQVLFRQKYAIDLAFHDPASTGHYPLILPSRFALENRRLRSGHPLLSLQQNITLGFAEGRPALRLNVFRNALRIFFDKYFIGIPVWDAPGSRQGSGQSAFAGRAKADDI